MEILPPQAPGLPPSISLDIEGDELQPYLWMRLCQHLLDSYAGVPLWKFPEDLRVYEHLLWLAAADTVIEIGTAHGGSALWFRDRLRALRAYGRIALDPHVISIDVDQRKARSKLQSADPGFPAEIELVEADVSDSDLPDRVASLLRPEARCLVVEDSSHTPKTTRAALDGFARFVPKGGFFVVEDGSVDIDAMRPPEHMLGDRKLPRGVLPTIEEWLDTPSGQEFAVRRDLELYGITSHPHGFLTRVA